ncbi:Co2+/Mg2+ efflux protein ApaG [Halochromatium salexigens]|uniref:Protein ApaG n=1 Tax=Halochromatium salexigens TaxID=49447 RepID=A0AAJ0XDQ2_HALSE|nr:Co2+/Mg2+ efflux protein ApaG [Halochromatium salexigens]MBK5929114.1 Co2+/Mg2+ efflux protein ApaG [Halochromatium salexigens]
MDHHDARYQIDVQALTRYLPEQSDPDGSRFTFAYTITISNTGEVPAKLLNRHWIVTDANGKTQEVRGAGVVGEQPYLQPGERFEYTSGTQIATPLGSMHGSYDMIADDGTRFDAVIRPFSLGDRSALH